MSNSESIFLPGVPEELVRMALKAAGGNEIESGKLASPESSAALAVNAFGRFLLDAAALPAFPVLADLDWPAVNVGIERQMRFPWQGGRHPWLDAAVETAACLIGIESKRYEPFRDRKTVNLSKAYDRDVWGTRMQPFTLLRDALRSGAVTFDCLDAAQLVKHAFGLVTEGRRIGKRPVLLYLFAEPEQRSGRPLDKELLALHRREIAQFAGLVAGAEVRFEAGSWREWLSFWPDSVASHREAIITRFQP